MFAKQWVNILPILIFIVYLLANPANAEVVTIANGNDFKPFTDEKLKKGGFYILQ